MLSLKQKTLNKLDSVDAARAPKKVALAYVDGSDTNLVLSEDRVTIARYYKLSHLGFVIDWSPKLKAYRVLIGAKNA